MKITRKIPIECVLCRGDGCAKCLDSGILYQLETEIMTAKETDSFLSQRVELLERQIVQLLDETQKLKEGLDASNPYIIHRQPYTQNPVYPNYPATGTTGNSYPIITGTSTSATYSTPTSVTTGANSNWNQSDINAYNAANWISKVAIDKNDNSLIWEWSDHYENSPEEHKA